MTPFAIILNIYAMIGGIVVATIARAKDGFEIACAVIVGLFWPVCIPYGIYLVFFTDEEDDDT